MKIRIDIKIFLFLILFYFTKQIKFFSFAMIFCILHECGHLIAGILLKFKPEKISVMPLGVAVEFKVFPHDYNTKIYNSSILELKKLIIAVAGPFVNLFFIILFLHIKGINKEMIVYSNILILIFNLIPIYPLDGGRIIKSILRITKGIKNAEKEMNIISNMSIIIITMLSGFIIYILKNISILIILIYLWYLVINENKKYQLKEKYYICINNSNGKS